MISQDLAVYEKSSIYEFDNNILLHYYPRRIAELFWGRGEESCLELGIGHGYTTEFFAEFFNRHVVLEGDGKVIRRFKREFPDIQTEIVKTYFEEWDTEEKFDVIIMGFILEHVEDPGLLIKKYRDFLKPKGRMFLTVPNAEALHRRVGMYAGILESLTNLSEADRLLGHKRYYTLTELKKQVVGSGLKVVREEGLFLKPVTTAQMIQLNMSEPVIEGFLRAGREYPELCCGLLVEAVSDQ